MGFVWFDGIGLPLTYARPEVDQKARQRDFLHTLHTVASTGMADRGSWLDDAT